MANLFDKIRARFQPVQPLPPGIYQYTAPPEDPLNYRLHLRLEADGQGILLINASTILHLNTTAAEHAYHLLQHDTPEEAASAIAARYRIDKQTALQDFIEFQEHIETLIATPDLDPVTYMDIDRSAPYSGELSAPYRLDCALTYRLPEGASQEAAPTKRVDRELTTEEWLTIIDKAWQAGIPHILFTGGEPTLRDDLPKLLQRAEDNGQVTGLLTNGLKLSDTAYLNQLLQAGLDHTMIVLETERNRTWEALSSFAYWKETLDEDLFVAAHLTMTTENQANFHDLIDKLVEAGISAISLSENDKSLSLALQQARDYANDQGLELIWDMPVPYSELNPVALELESPLQDDTFETKFEAETMPEPQPIGPGHGWLYVEPDGDVLPGQGINHVLGNLLSEEWGKIWHQ